MVQLLRQNNYLVIRVNSANFGRFNQYNCSGWFTPKLHKTKGVADLYCLSPDGISYWLELKSQTGSQTDDQKSFMNHVKARKGKYIIIDNLAYLKQRLNIK